MKITVRVELRGNETGQIDEITRICQENSGRQIFFSNGEPGSGIKFVLVFEFAHPKKAAAFTKEMLENWAFYEIVISRVY